MPFIAVPPDAHEFLRDLSSQLDCAPAEPAKLIETGPSGLAYWNCYEHARRHGGRIVHGWQVLAWPGIYIELLHHAVVEDADGNLIDPTTCTALHSGQALFIEDKHAIMSRRNPPPIASRFILYPGDGEEIGRVVQDARERYFAIKRHLAGFIEQIGLVARPVIADYPWPGNPEVAALLEEKITIEARIEELHARCIAWDVKRLFSVMPPLGNMLRQDWWPTMSCRSQSGPVRNGGDDRLRSC